MSKTILRRICVGILCCFALGAGTAYANTTEAPQSTQQSSKVSGIVKDSNGDPVVGASVLVKGTTSGVSTDLDGKFSVTARPGDILIVNYVGMKSQTLAAQDGMEITLTDDAAQLDEVVVLGYGASKRNKTFQQPLAWLATQNRLLSAQFLLQKACFKVNCQVSP